MRQTKASAQKKTAALCGGHIRFLRLPYYTTATKAVSRRRESKALLSSRHGSLGRNSHLYDKEVTNFFASKRAAFYKNFFSAHGFLRITFTLPISFSPSVKTTLSQMAEPNATLFDSHILCQFPVPYFRCFCKKGNFHKLFSPQNMVFILF